MTLRASVTAVINRLTIGIIVTHSQVVTQHVSQDEGSHVGLEDVAHLFGKENTDFTLLFNYL